jgi:hypothetical protein
MPNEAFFRKEDDKYLPNPICRGPWDPNSLHGRVIAGLLAFEIEQRHGDAEMLPARLTVDMYRLPDFSPIEISTRVVRDGYRIKVVDAEFVSGGNSMGRASCQLLRRTANPEVRVWSPPNWDVPSPEQIEVPEERASALGGMWAMRPIAGGFGTFGQKRTWMSEVRDLVEEVPLTPWMRVALAADFASPFANSGEGGLAYINTDITLYLHRLPEDEWVGLEVVNHQSTDGVAIGECLLYDRKGSIGSSAVAALAQRRK